MIKVENLCKYFLKDGHRIEVLVNLNLEIPQGDSLAVLGVSGAGKSTLVHVLGTLDRPSEGIVTYDGTNVFQWKEKQLAEFRNKRIGFIFQFHNLLPEFTSAENVAMPALISGMARGRAREKAEALLGELGLGHRISHKPGELSGGEQQRVAVARAMIMEPNIILADEPTGNLDSETGKKVEETLLDLNKTRKITLVVVTHNESLAARMQRSVRLRDGKLINEQRPMINEDALR